LILTSRMMYQHLSYSRLRNCKTVLTRRCKYFKWILNCSTVNCYIISYSVRRPPWLRVEAVGDCEQYCSPFDHFSCRAASSGELFKLEITGRALITSLLSRNIVIIAVDAWDCDVWECDPTSLTLTLQVSVWVTSPWVHTSLTSALWPLEYS